MPLYNVTFDVQEIKGYAHTESRFSLTLRTERDLATLQEILLNAGNEVNVGDLENEDRRFDELVAQFGQRVGP